MAVADLRLELAAAGAEKSAGRVQDAQARDAWSRLARRSAPSAQLAWAAEPYTPDEVPSAAQSYAVLEAVVAPQPLAARADVARRREAAALSMP